MMLSIITLLAIVLLIWLWVTTLQHKKDIEILKQDIENLTAKIYAENQTNKSQNNKSIEIKQTEPMVKPVAPQTQPMKTFSPPSDSYRVQPHAPEVEKVSKVDAESWFGRNVIGIMASILVFIGLVFLGVLAYEHITETQKIIAMYVISSVVLGLSFWLNGKKRNNFTLILLGCGCGSFFISILLTHIYFNRINDILAFSLLLVWMAATLLLSKKVLSTQLSIVAHIGMAVSICFAFGLKLTDEKLAILLIYQCTAIAIILLGNIFCCRKTYNFGIFVSLVLTIITSSFMWERFTSRSVANLSAYPFATTLPTALIAAAFFVQFICGSFLSYLLSVSTTRLKSGNRQIAIHSANKILWITSLIINVYFVVLRIASISGDYLKLVGQHNLSAFLPAVMITLAIIFIHSVLTIILSLKFNFNGKLETISIFLLSGVASILLLIFKNWNQILDANTFIPRITWLIIISLLLILAGHIAKNKAYSIGATFIIAVDALFMFTGGYRTLNRLGSFLLPLGYLVLYNLIIWLQWYLLDSKGRETYKKPARLSCFFLTELSLVLIFVTSSLEFKTEILLITLTLLNTLLYLIHFDKDTKTSKDMRWLFGTNEFVILSIVSGFIAFAKKDLTSSVLYLVLAALAFGYAFIKIRSVLDGSNNSIESVWTGLKITILVLAVIRGNTSWFEQAYIFSVICMLTALLCIILGFIGRAKTLRYYGLALTLLCILKLVTYDVTNLNTPLRVLTFIGGGIICFIISAIYNYASKKLAPDENQKTTDF